jgi:hypothetical protein
MQRSKLARYSITSSASASKALRCRAFASARSKSKATLRDYCNCCVTFSSLEV